MGLFKGLFQKKQQASEPQPPVIEANKSTAEAHFEQVSLPPNHHISMGQVGIDLQVVLVSDPIDNQEIASLYAFLLGEKYSVKTKVSKRPSLSLGEKHSDKVDVSKLPQKPQYEIWLYRIDLSLISNRYDPSTKRWNFYYNDLNAMQGVNTDEIIRSTAVGHSPDIYLNVELKRNPCSYKILHEDPYYQYYKYKGGTLLRYDKQTARVTIVGRFVQITDCIHYHGKLYISEERGFTGDREIYQCLLNGDNMMPLHCLSNEKICRAGHAVSEDTVKEMRVVGDVLEITVMRNGSNKYDYKLIITDASGDITIEKRFAR